MSSCSCFWDLVDVSMGPETNYLWLWIHQITHIIQESYQIISENILLRVLEILEVGNFENFGKAERQTILTIRLIDSWRSWIWDQYFSKNIKWKFGNMGSSSSKNIRYLLKLWDSETKKPRNQETKTPSNYETKKPRNQETKKPRN